MVDREHARALKNGKDYDYRREYSVMKRKGHAKKTTRDAKIGTVEDLWMKAEWREIGPEPVF
jgi:hypothetical protein